MKKWTLLEQVKTPDGSTMTLNEHDGSLALRVNGRELMSTRHVASEVKLAEVACAHVRTKRGACVLVGGLGMGFTLRSALANLSADATVVVAELIPEVVEWNRNPAYGLAKAELEDHRTRIEVKDVADVINQSFGRFDAIMLDADNGTTAMFNAGNQSLYLTEGLIRVHAALKPAGVAVYWSVSEEPRFVKLMGKSGFKVEVLKVRSHPTSGGWHRLIIGRKQ